MVKITGAADAVWAVLDGVMDPEVPVLSVVELGIVRDVDVDDNGAVTVSVTPTYSGCPALHVIEHDIVDALAAAGWPDARLRTVYSPPWTTDWIGESARQKLIDYGIAPPSSTASTRDARGDDQTALVPLRRRTTAVACPFCGSDATTVRSEFGSTACKSLMQCSACGQPFELFKAI